MALSNGQKVGLVAAVGVGAFLLAGGSSKQAKAAVGTPPLDCTNPKDCAQLTTCATAVMATATKADVPVLQGMLVTANKLGCAALAKDLTTLITNLTKVVVTPPPKTTQKYTILAGEGPAEVATKFGTTVEALLLLNPDLKSGLTGQEVSPFTNAVKGSSYMGTAEGQIDASGSLSVVAIFNPTMGIVSAGGKDGYPVYASSIRVKGASNNYVYFPSGKGGQPYAAGGPNPSLGRAFYAAEAWRFVAPWRTGQVINVPFTASVGGEATPLRHNHPVRAGVGSESVAGCSACDAKHSAGGEINNPESFGPYNTVPAYDEGYVKFDRAFGSSFGAPKKGHYLSKTRVFGRNSFWGH